ncbi:AfsR/SARP family transcriptional regulator [Amycolatopsis minnesotensis]|uniref:OmpR/PhoB-type domain-containing protein n=1 Tax=Amycolatopsis minnesotensis TaxID=337894 RepID=A0ABN2QJJ1_9PSEU
MRYKVLGQLEVIDGSITRTPSAAKVRQTLALLLLRANQVVPLDSLLYELWDDNPPRSGVTTAQTYIYQIRKMLAEEYGDESAKQLLKTVPAGYLLRAEPEQLDVWRFDGLVESARECRDSGEVHSAAERLRDALALWAGSALSNVTCGRLLQGYSAYLEDKRISALELRIKADMMLGMHHELIAELRSLVVEHPFNEWFHAQLILALNRSGRRNEALRAYRDIRTLLNDELGLDPFVDLQRVHQGILEADVPDLVG